MRSRKWKPAPAGIEFGKERLPRRGRDDAMEKAYLFLADGFEEVEGLTVADLLRRAEVPAVMVSITGKKSITGSHGIKTEADALFEETAFDDGTVFILPGGMPGTTALKEHGGLQQLLCDQFEKGKRIAAICAAPTALGRFGILKGKKATCYPGLEDGLTGAEPVQDPVVTDGSVTTSRGVGTAIPFALELIRLLCGSEKADRIANSIVYRK